VRNYGLTAFGGRCEAIEAPDRKPQGREVLVEVTRCGVCHSDVHIQDGYYDLGGGKRFSMSDRGLKLPVMLGHEIVGRLVEIGPEASIGQDQIGRDFILFPWIGCGECDVCRAGKDNICTKPAYLGLQQPGGTAERLIVPDAKYLVGLEGIDYDAAATYACSGLTVYSALKKLDEEAKSASILLIGAGGLGQIAVGIAKALGFRDVVVADLDEKKRKQAEALGADRSVDPASEEGRASLAGMAGVVDFVGSPKTLEMGVASLRRGGRYIVVGLFGGEATLSIPLFTLRPIAVMGSLTGTLSELRELLDLVREHKPPPAAIELRPRAEINAALDAVRAGTAKGRIVLTA
jgi:D-arabinose 1-dehydrogenase-like Zn-dependent alcohol dehydrogenase